MSSLRRNAALVLAALTLAGGAWAAGAASGSSGAEVLQLPGVSVKLTGQTQQQEVSNALRVLLALTVLSLAPAILMCMTAFVRIVIVLSMVRHAIGLQETPPNSVLISLALFLTLFSMLPVLERINTEAFQPYMEGKMQIEQASAGALQPLREFMLKQTRQEDLALMTELSKAPAPASAEDIRTLQLIPAFMLSELRSAFQIAFVVFVPFLLIDLIVSTVLMSLGMMMVPPATIALPLKLLMFVLIDGWHVLVRALLGTIH
jgi:flagellar biosynthetic protein FliP